MTLSTRDQAIVVPRRRPRRLVSKASVFRPAQIDLDPDGNRLTYSGSGREVVVTRALLEELTEMATLPTREQADGVLRFARRWGPLGICQHRDSLARLPFSFAAHPTCDPVGEPVRVWIRTARWMGAALRAAQGLKDGKPAIDQDWAILCPSDLDPGLRRPSLRCQQHHVAAELDVLIRMAAPRVSPTWEDDMPRLRWSVEGAYGAAALLLLTEAGGAESIGFCHNPQCLEPFNMHRRSDRYCETCQKDGAPDRIRQQKHRAKGAARKAAELDVGPLLALGMGITPAEYAAARRRLASRTAKTRRSRPAR